MGISFSGKFLEGLHTQISIPMHSEQLFVHSNLVILILILKIHYIAHDHPHYYYGMYIKGTSAISLETTPGAHEPPKGFGRSWAPDNTDMA